MSPASLRGRWVVLCDGDVVASFAVELNAHFVAVHHSLGDEFSAVALCRLGDASSLRRFANGAPLDPPRSPR